MSVEYVSWFERITSHPPHAWQTKLGEASVCEDRLIRIPTGFGKTAGTVLSWLFHRVHRDDRSWPCRLVFVLPMRVLVEQTEVAIAEWLTRAGLSDRVALRVLMGGRGAEPWALDVEKPAILVGTQDMILSRALNRGYAAARGRWPMEFGLLHQDSLWVMDEIQLMDVGLATTAQLAAFREAERRVGRSLRPTHSWWMSATLQPSWLKTVDFADAPDRMALQMLRVDLSSGKGSIGASKSLERANGSADPASLAKLAQTRHRPGTLTLIIVNQVPRAVEVFAALDREVSEGKGAKKKRRSDAPDLQLIHSHFRGHERRAWITSFLRKDAPMPPQGRIVVSTQVVEAGVDISARVLITDLAPWPSLVQRMGRAARYAAEQAEIVVVGEASADPKAARPYDPKELASAEQALQWVLRDGADASTEALERLEATIRDSDPELLARLYPYEPQHVLRREDLDDLFDTTPDLTGADLDVSRYIRSGEERDVTVFWRALPSFPGARLEPEHLAPKQPGHDELCPLPVGRFRAWLKTKRQGHAYVFDYLEGAWLRLNPDRVRPGLSVLLDTELGGYSLDVGWNDKSEVHVPVVPQAEEPVSASEQLTATSSSADTDALSAQAWKTIAQHGAEVATVIGRIADAVGLPAGLRDPCDLSGRWHDIGKGLSVFQGAIGVQARTAAGPIGDRQDLAKAPVEAWKKPAYPARPGFRHELASGIALFELLRTVAPDHPAFAEQLASRPAEQSTPVDIDPRIREDLSRLDAEAFDLAAWLTVAHHGKVRMGLTSTPLDQDKGHGGIHGICEGDTVAPCELRCHDGKSVTTPPVAVSLALASMGLSGRYGASWVDRCQRLLERHGPFALAYLEAIVRAADARASRDSGKEGGR
jgi:CRISPR-associated endonuclease/helicase Cas3